MRPYVAGVPGPAEAPLQLRPPLSEGSHCVALDPHTSLSVSCFLFVVKLLTLHCQLCLQSYAFCPCCRFEIESCLEMPCLLSSFLPAFLRGGLSLSLRVPLQGFFTQIQAHGGCVPSPAFNRGWRLSLRFPPESLSPCRLFLTRTWRRVPLPRGCVGLRFTAAPVFVNCLSICRGKLPATLH